MVYKRQRSAIQDLAGILWQTEAETRAKKRARIVGRLEIKEPPRLFGVDDKLAELTAALATAESPWLVAVVGIGGIGKPPWPTPLFEPCAPVPTLPMWPG
jgi:hypothetical protein